MATALTGRSWSSCGTESRTSSELSSTHTKVPGGHAVQRPVVGAAAAAEPHAVAADGEAGDQHDVGRGDRVGAQGRAVGLEQPAARGAQAVRSVVRRPVEVVVGLEQRQDHPLAGALSASSSGPVPGSLETETYAATVAARRISGAAAGGPRAARARSPMTAQREVTPGRQELVAQGQFGDPHELLHNTSLRSKHELEGTAAGAREDAGRGRGPSGHRRLRALLPADRARRDRHDRREHDRPAGHGVAGRRRGQRRDGLRRHRRDGRDQAQRRARHLDGDGPREVAALRTTRAVLPRRDRPPGAAPAPGVRRHAAADLHEQLPHLGRHPGRPGALRRPRRRGPAAGVPAEQGAQAARRRPHAGRLAARPLDGVVSARPR